MKSNRYVFFKRCYPDYLILINKNNKIKSYNFDKKLLYYLEIENIKKLEKLNINYLILENICRFNILIEKIKNVLSNF